MAESNPNRYQSFIMWLNLGGMDTQDIHGFA